MRGAPAASLGKSDERPAWQVSELVFAVSELGAGRVGQPHQFTSRRIPLACLLLAMNSCSLRSVMSQRWLLRALILRT